MGLIVYDRVLIYLVCTQEMQHSYAVIGPSPVEGVSPNTTISEAHYEYAVDEDHYWEPSGIEDELKAQLLDSATLVISQDNLRYFWSVFDKL